MNSNGTSTVSAEPELVDAVINSRLTVGDLWRRYFKLGGGRTRQELQSFLGLESRWGRADRDMLTRALAQS